MKSNSKIRRTLIATLMVFATAAIGMQPLLFSMGSGCTCETSASVDSRQGDSKLSDSKLNDSATTCCGELAKAQKSCCSSKKVATKACCCDPVAAACECGDCGCSDNGSNSSLPAIPTNETKDVVSPTLICAARLVGYPRQCDLKRVDVPGTVVEHTALSSQQTCVLLSRFTC